MKNDAQHRSVGVLGLGEAGSLIAADLAGLDVAVCGWDPAVKRVNAPVVLAGSDREAVLGSDVVLSVNASTVAEQVAVGVAPVLRSGQIFADLNTGTPALKSRIAHIVAPTGALFADVAMMAPVPGRGLRTPALVSGEGAQRFIEIFAPLGMPVELVDGAPGAAAARKLLRSIFMKGFAAAIIEGLIASQELGCVDWFVQNLVETVTNADEALVRRFVVGSRKHAKRRTAEMQAVSELLLSHNIHPRVAMASAEWLQELSVSPERLPIPAALDSGAGSDALEKGSIVSNKLEGEPNP